MSKTREIEVRINGTLRDEPARVLLELKKRGLCRTNLDGISQGLLILWERVLDRDAKQLRVQTLTDREE